MRIPLQKDASIYSTVWIHELHDHSVVEEIQSHLSSGSLSPAQWSPLVFVLLTSEEELGEFDLKKYSRSEEGLLRLLPVIKASRTAMWVQNQQQYLRSHQQTLHTLFSLFQFSQVKSWVYPLYFLGWIDANSQRDAVTHWPQLLVLLTPERDGHEWQWPVGFRGEVALFWTGKSTL